MVHPIQDGRIRLDRREGEEASSPGKTTKTAATELAGAHGLGEPVHQITRDRYGSNREGMGISPGTKMESEVSWVKCAASNGGRLCTAKYGEG